MPCRRRRHPSARRSPFLRRFPGPLWGRPMWGTYWAWDPRLTSELILLFLYVGVMSLRSAFEDPARGDRAAALLAIVGLVNVPIIHYSVLWWNSLHQGATVAKLGKPEMPGSMLWPLLSMFLGFMLFYGAVLCMRLQGEVLNRERQATWVREAIESGRAVASCPWGVKAGTCGPALCLPC